MKPGIPLITEFISALRIRNAADVRLDIRDRYSAAFIFPLRGRIRFTGGGVSAVACAEQPVYIPAGATYLNECLEDADSIVLNFIDSGGFGEITALRPLSAANATMVCDRICALASLPSKQNQAEIFSLLYRVMADCFGGGTATGAVIAAAMEAVEVRLHDPELNLDALARHCHISKVYLSRLFVQETGMPPFRYITQVRMERAKYLLMEKCPVSEVARSVGYSDVYQFSRAYRRYHGLSPKKHLSQLLG